MATRTISANLTSPTYATLTDGDYIYYSNETWDDGAVSSGKINSAYITITNFRVYGGSCYLSIYVGGEKVGETVEMDTDDYGGGSTTTVEVEMEYLEEAILWATGEIELHCYNNNSSTGDTYGVRSSGTATITVDYTGVELGYPTINSATQTNTHINISWSHASYNGSATRKYNILASASGLWDDSYGTLGTGYTGTSASIAIQDSWRGKTLNLWLIAYADDYPASRWSSGYPITIQQLGCIRYCDNGTWKECIPYYVVNGAWKECIPYYCDNGVWKEVN